MRYLLVIVLLALFFLPGVLGSNITVEAQKIENLVIAELNNSAIYDLKINTPVSDDFDIYTLVGVSIQPEDKVRLEAGENTVRIEATLSEELRNRLELLSIEYQIFSFKTGLFKDQLLVRTVSIEDIFSLSGRSFSTENKETTISIKNNQEIALEGVNVEVSSIFFNYSESLNFQPLEEKEITVPLKFGDVNNILAGSYVVDADFNIQGNTFREEGTVSFLEIEDIIESEESSGIIIRRLDLEKFNNGTVSAIVSVEAQRGIVGRLFTTYNLDPKNIDREGFRVNYVWEKEVGPGESLDVVVKTNYTIPFVVLVLIGLIVFFVRRYSLTDLSLEKKIGFVKTKGGEFALRVRVRVKARKNVKDVEIIDNIPTITKLYNKFGRHPDKIDKNTRNLHWNLGDLQRGEERVISYIIYSKIGAVGRFSLPVARANYGLGNKRKNSSSNSAHFVSDTSEN